jgi:hypothetical protein
MNIFLTGNLGAVNYLADHMAYPPLAMLLFAEEDEHYGDDDGDGLLPMYFVNLWTVNLASFGLVPHGTRLYQEIPKMVTLWNATERNRRNRNTQPVPEFVKLHSTGQF